MEYTQIVLWLGVLAGLSALGLPIANLVFARLPGRGAGFAPTIALGVVSIVAYWFGHVRFGPIALVAGLLVLVSVAVVALSVEAELDVRSFGESMVVFGSAFCLVIGIRAVDPGIIPYTEAFLNYGMVQSLLRAPRLPPEDFWFAGTTVRYHYGGHLVVALQTMLTGTRPAVAFNLSLASFFAMLVAGAYELAGAIAAADGRSRYAAGFLGAYFVGVAGNLLVPAAAVVQVLPQPVGPAVESVIASDLGKEAATVVTEGLTAFEYWDADGMIPDAITPFPLFVGLHGELHAHLNSAPFFLLAGALCYAYYRTPARERTRRRLLVFVAFPFAGGFALLTSIWTAPTLLGLLWLAVSFAPARPSSLLSVRLRTDASTLQPFDENWLRTELRRVGSALVVSAIVACLVVAVSAPFTVLTTKGGKESLAVVEQSNRTGTFALLLVHGGFLALFAPYLAAPIRSRVAGSVTQTRVTTATLVLVVFGVLSDIPALLLFVPIVAAGWYVLRSDPEQFEVVLVVAGAGLLLLVEFVYVSNQEYVIPTRGNTVYRTYWHSWILWGIAAGVIVPRLVRPPNVSWVRLPKRRPFRSTLVVCVILSSAAYGGLAGYNHFDGALEESDEWSKQTYVHEATETETRSVPPTLDGTLWMDVWHPNQSDAARWMNRNVDGTPTMITAPGGRWETRSVPAALTGVPTVAGWAHQLVYRDWDTYYERVTDVRTMYHGPPDRRVELLSKYDVRFVYVGPDERQRYDIWEFSLLDGVTAVYENEDVVIYDVDQSELGYSPDRVDRRRYTAGDFGINETVASYDDDGIGVDSSGALAWYGPSVTLPPGEYEVTFNLSVDTTDGVEQPVGVDVARGANGTADFRILGNTTVNETDGARAITVPFTLSRPATDVEFRGRLLNQSGTVTLHSVTVERRSTNGSGGQ